MQSFLQDFRRQIRNGRYAHLGIEVPQRSVGGRRARRRTTTTSRSTTTNNSNGASGRTKRKRRETITSTTTFDNGDDTGIDYVLLADRNKLLLERKLQQQRDQDQRPASEENIAWKMLDTLTHNKNGNTSNGTKTPQRFASSTATSNGRSTSPNKVEKFKRPKRALKHHQLNKLASEPAIQTKHAAFTSTSTLQNSSLPSPAKSPEEEIEAEKLLPPPSMQLTQEALQQHNSTTSNIQHSSPESSKEHHPQQQLHRHSSATPLSYTQKLLIQRLLIKPHIKSLRLSTLQYTALNKNISRKLYQVVVQDNDAFHWLNLMEELSERENLDLKDKLQMEKFLDMSNEVVVGGDSGDNVDEMGDDEKENSVASDCFTKERFVHCFGNVVGSMITEELKVTAAGTAP
ncbi:unnamed protein product [Ambrosiozyma monospora]|uniref:Unnamed protein product n=1 Tax=Ambrosiozyma monospora TaxID=43982 RepID=A0ACB5U5Y0_AMBMO|nr:unnamed protein product [Ambrosiozyma monospora]